MIRASNDLYEIGPQAKESVRVYGELINAWKNAGATATSL
jgi:hypothetical protein